MRWMTKMTKRMTTMATPPQRLVRVPPALSLTACPPCPSQRWPPPSLLLIIRTCWETATSRRCLATSPPCRVSRSRRRPPTATPAGGSAVGRTEACSGPWVAGSWFHLRPPPWTKTSQFPPQTFPRPPPACPHPGWTTPAARLQFPPHPHLQPTATCPHIVTSRLMPVTSRPDGTSPLCVISPPRGTWGWQGDTGETSPPGGDTCRCSPLSLDPRLPQEETISATFRRAAATGG